MIHHRRCDQPTCLYPFTGATKSNHKAEFHSGGHGFLFQGAVVRVQRRSDGMIPCPCGLEEHARYSFKKLTNLNKQNPHPGPDASEWADHPVEEMRRNLPPLPLPPSITPLLERKSAVQLSSYDGLIPNTPTLRSQSSTTLETHTLHTFRNDELSSLQTGQLRDSDMVDEDFEQVNDVESRVVEKETGGEGDAEVVNEFNRGDELEDDEDEEDEEDVPSEDEAPLVEGDDMDIDLAPSSLSPSETVASLSRFNIIVEPVYRLSICTECAIPVRLEHMYTHQKTKHFKGLTLPPELSFPSRAIFDSLLATLGANQPLQIPVGPIPRIQGVQIVHGLKCTLPGCIGEVF
ncbi:hypothetical protein F5876DRAFT_84374 [Lentinula aff. lateritia]|uniref:Uncharacterized protein n=1 Tax=Lentinula aff. lateritia TaxID=2804960 RepID=A0ACC1TGL1_9AGAR|nr:hypothetical protein F5876DRAFT_84374 [Lentinula aff. lateritia]